MASATGCIGAGWSEGDQTWTVASCSNSTPRLSFMPDQTPMIRSTSWATWTGVAHARSTNG